MFQALRPLPSTFSIAATTLQQFGRSSRRARGLRAGRPATLTPPSMGKNRKNKNKKRMLPVLGEALTRDQVAAAAEESTVTSALRLLRKGTGKRKGNPWRTLSMAATRARGIHRGPPEQLHPHGQQPRPHGPEVHASNRHAHPVMQKSDCDMSLQRCACPRGCTRVHKSGEAYCNDCAPGTGNAPCFCICWCTACMMLG